MKNGPRNESRTHGAGVADRSVSVSPSVEKTVQGGISTREPYPRQRISFLPLWVSQEAFAAPFAYLAPFPKHWPRPSGPPSRCQLVR